MHQHRRRLRGPLRGRQTSIAKAHAEDERAPRFHRRSDEPSRGLRGSLRADSNRARIGRETIGPNDLLVAAHACAAGLAVVTGNEREFRRVPGCGWRTG